MTHSAALNQDLAQDARDVALEILALLRDIDPARFRAEFAEHTRERIRGIQARLTQLVEAAQAQDAPQLRARLLHLAELLRDHVPQHGASAEEIRERWMAWRAQVMDGYEALSKRLETLSVHVPALRPTNYKRNVFHVAWGSFAIAIVAFVLTPPQMLYVAGGFALFGWSMEIARRIWPAANVLIMKAFAPYAHPHEYYRINSATWYATALTIISLTGRPEVCVPALAVLTFADPAAALVGRRYGRTKLMNGRSLEGSTAFLLVGIVAASVVLATIFGLGTGASLLVAFGAAAPATVAELVSRRIDDNLSIPVTAAAGAMAALALLGLA